MYLCCIYYESINSSDFIRLVICYGDKNEQNESVIYELKTLNVVDCL